MNPNSANNNNSNPQWPNQQQPNNGFNNLTAANTQGNQNYQPQNIQPANQIPQTQNLQANQISDSVVPQADLPVSQTSSYLQNLNLDKYDKLLDDINASSPPLDLTPQNLQSMQGTAPVMMNKQPPNLQSQMPQQPQTQVNPVQQFQPQQNPTQVHPVNSQNQIPQQTLQNSNNVPLNPNILAQSLVHSENKQAQENQMGSVSASPEIAAESGNDSQAEKAVENIMEQLKNVENSPEDTSENAKPNSDNQSQDAVDVKEDVKDHTKAANSAIGKVKVYGYQLPQKLLNLASAGKLSKGVSSDVSSTKTWLVALVGRIIQIKSLSD